MDCANKEYKKYRESGGTLIFKDWLNREKEKNFLNYNGQQQVPVNRPLNDSIQDVINKMNAAAGYKQDLENKYIFGVNKNVWVGLGITAALVLAGVFIYKKYKS